MATAGASGSTIGERRFSGSIHFPIMNKALLLSPLLAASALLSGCVGTGPNTQQGAVSGGALGAIAGAIIGHNSRGGDALGGAILGGTVGAIAGGAMGNSVDHQNGTVYSEYPERRVYRRAYRVETASPPPPAPIQETVSAPPAANAVWVPGFWTFDGRAYSWNTGHWEVPPPLAQTYVPGHWENRGGTNVYVQASWR
jgi:phage tail tape-measure protein